MSIYVTVDLGSAIYLQSLIVNFTRVMHFYKSGMRFALLYFAVVGPVSLKAENAQNTMQGVPLVAGEDC